MRSSSASSDGDGGKALRGSSATGGVQSPEDTPRASPEPAESTVLKPVVEMADKGVSTSLEGRQAVADAAVSPMPSPPAAIRQQRAAQQSPVQLGSEWDLLSSERSSLFESVESLLGIARRLSPASEGEEVSRGDEEASEGEYLLSSEGEFYAPRRHAQPQRSEHSRSRSRGAPESAEDEGSESGMDVSEGQIFTRRQSGSNQLSSTSAPLRQGDESSSGEFYQAGIRVPNSPGEIPRFGNQRQGK